MTKQCHFNYVFHYCLLLNRKYHAVIEQEQNISGTRQYFLEVTGWNCKGIEILWIVSLRKDTIKGLIFPGITWSADRYLRSCREDCVIHRSEILENVCLGKSLLYAQRVCRKGACRLETEEVFWFPTRSDLEELHLAVCYTDPGIGAPLSETDLFLSG